MNIMVCSIYTNLVVFLCRELLEELSGEEEGSYSSRMSNKSEKNMADFDGEESGCEDELVQLAAQAHVSYTQTLLQLNF